MFPIVFSVVVFDLSEKVKSEKHSLIIRVRASDLCLADLKWCTVFILS